MSSRLPSAVNRAKHAPSKTAPSGGRSGPGAERARAKSAVPRLPRTEQPKRTAELRRRTHRIVEAAVELADAGGVEAVRTRDICNRAGVTMGTLYRVFDSKEEILLRAFGEDLLSLEAHFARRPAEGATPLERVDAFFRVATEAFFSRPNYARAVIAALASGQNRPLAELEALVGRMTRLIDEALLGRRDDAVSGARPASSDPQRTSIILHRVWFALLVGWAGAVYSTDAVRRELSATAIHLLSGDARTSPAPGKRVVGGK